MRTFQYLQQTVGNGFVARALQRTAEQDKDKVTSVQHLSHLRGADGGQISKAEAAPSAALPLGVPNAEPLHSDSERALQPAVTDSYGGSAVSYEHESAPAFAGPESLSSRVPGGGQAKSAPVSSATTGKTVPAHASPLQAEAKTQAQLINTDSAQSLAQVSRIAATRREQISNQFSGVRKGFSNFFTTAVTGVQKAIAAKQTEITNASTGVLKSVQKVITGALTAAQSQADKIRDAITGFVQNITDSLQTKAQGVANQIQGAINAIPLPDIPGVAQIRNVASSLLQQATSVVTNALGQVLGIIRQAVNAGMDLLGSLLSAVGRSVNQVLSGVAAQISRVVQSMAQALSRVATLLISKLKNVLTGVLNPGLSRVEKSVAGALSKAEKQAIAAIQANRQQHLKAVADALHPPAGGGGGSPGSGQKGGPADAVAALQQIGRDAVNNNHLIVQTFEEKTSGALALLFGSITTSAARMVQSLAAVAADALQMIAGKVAQFVSSFGQVVQAVTGSIQSLLRSFATAVGGVFDSLKSIVQNPADKLLEFAQNAWSRIKDFASSLVRNLMSGGGIFSSVKDAIGEFVLSKGPITKPRPGGPLVPILEGILLLLFAIGAIVVVMFPALAAIVAALADIVGLTAALIIVGAAVVLLLIALILLLLYLLSKLLKPKPVPRPRPPTCTITTRTLAAAPDGTADTRTTVGVNEQAELTASTAVTWAATCGKITPTGGTTSIWTAPDTRTSCTINATPASASRCSVSFTVLPPKQRILTKKTDRSYSPGLAGSGFVADVVIMPTNVSFTRIQVREGTVKAVSKGYYRKVFGRPSHPIGKWLTVNSKNSGIIDTVGTNPPGSPGPFSKGTFSWAIPQQYRVPGTGSAIRYSTGNHIQQMTGTTGEETTSKETAKGGPRKP